MTNGAAWKYLTMSKHASVKGKRDGPTGEFIENRYVSDQKLVTVLLPGLSVLADFREEKSGPHIRQVREYFPEEHFL